MEEYPIQEAIRTTDIENLHLLQGSASLANYDFSMGDADFMGERFRSSMAFIQNKQLKIGKNSELFTSNEIEPLKLRASSNQKV